MSFLSGINANQFGDLLNKLNDAELSPQSGVVRIAKGELSVRVKSSNKENVDFTLSNIVKKSNDIINNRETSSKELEEISKGLRHLSDLVGEVAEQHEITLSEAQSRVRSSIDETAKKISRLGLEKSRNETSSSQATTKKEPPVTAKENIITTKIKLEESVAQEPVADIASMDIKPQLLKIIGQSTIVEGEIGQIIKLIGQHPGKLFNLNKEGNSFFSLINDKCSREVVSPLVKHVIEHINQLTSADRNNFLDFIFVKVDSGRSIFEELMEKDDANEIFEQLLSSIIPVINDKPTMREQVFKFGYSQKRYDYVLLNEKDLSMQELEGLDTSRKRLRIDFESSIADLLSNQDKTYQNWTKERQSSSSTAREDGVAKKRWLKAEAYRNDYIKRDHEIAKDRSLKGESTLVRQFQRSSIERLHAYLCAGEDGVTPGEIRSGIVRAGGGGVMTHMYCPAEYLDDRFNTFCSWLNEGIGKCERGELNPIVLGAQAYQRLVSIHPFENGNGRITRMVMDYIFERFNLPPPILGSDISDGVFPLDPKNLSRNKDYLKKIITGISRSRELIAGK